MKHLYIIGNGFDIHTGLATRYADFRLWLEKNYPFIYENMQMYTLTSDVLRSLSKRFGTEIVVEGENLEQLIDLQNKMDRLKAMGQDENRCFFTEILRPLAHEMFHGKSVFLDQLDDIAYYEKVKLNILDNIYDVDSIDDFKKFAVDHHGELGFQV